MPLTLLARCLLSQELQKALVKVARTRVKERLEFNCEHLRKRLPGFPQEQRDTAAPLPWEAAGGTGNAWALESDGPPGVLVQTLILWDLGLALPQACTYYMRVHHKSCFPIFYEVGELE